MASPRVRYPGAESFVPDTRDVAELAESARHCQGCDLYQRATQTVFGEWGGSGRSPTQADVMLLGEQPGDLEDKQGEPFVGPAGGLLHRALERVGISPERSYLTNAVKHFRWHGERGKRRLHQRPDTAQVAACRPWLFAELASVRPRVIVVLGATAGQSLFGSSFRVGAARGRVVEWTVPRAANTDLLADVPESIETVATVHPSAVLRDPDRDAAMDAFVADLTVVSERIGR